MIFRRLDDTMLVAPQITAADVAEAAAHGVTLIINNRPDGEEPGQPAGAEIAVAAEAAGLGYRAIPVTLPQLGRAEMEAMAEALAGAGDGNVLAFCRSGTRSTYLWALARAAAGDEPADLAAKAAAAGYDLAPLRPTLEALAAER